MRRPNVLRPVVELFSDGEILDVNMLNRHCAFSAPQYFPLRRLKTYRDRVEINFRDRNRPPQIILIERTRMHFGNTRPWLTCYKCSRRCAKLYVSSIDVACRQCAEMQYRSQRQRRRARLKTRLEKVRSQLWIEDGKIIRPRNMPKGRSSKDISEQSARSNTPSSTADIIAQCSRITGIASVMQTADI